MPKITDTQLLKAMLVAAPAFQKIHEREKEKHDCGMTLVMEDLCDFTEDALRKKQLTVVKRIAAFLNKSYAQGNKRVEEIIITGFIEGMEPRALGNFYLLLSKELRMATVVQIYWYWNNESNNEFRRATYEEILATHKSKKKKS